MTGDRDGQNGTIHVNAYDQNLETYFNSTYADWQYIQIDLGCEGDFWGIRRYMTRDGADIFGERTLQGESIAYSLDGQQWTSLNSTNTYGWENYVNYGPNGAAWHSVDYGWSQWLRLYVPVGARYIRFVWDDDFDAVNEIKVDFAQATPTPTATPTPICSDLLYNGDFESGSAAPWTMGGAAGLGVGRNGSTGAWLAYIDGVSANLFHNVEIPATASSAWLSFWSKADGGIEQPNDLLILFAHEPGRAIERVTLPAQAPLGVWQRQILDFSRHSGQLDAISFVTYGDAQQTTVFRIDDVSLVVCGVTPTPTATASNTPSPTPTFTLTPTKTPSATPSPTPSRTPSQTPSRTPSPTPSWTPSPTPSQTPSRTPSPTPSLTPSHTATETPSVTATHTATLFPSLTTTPTLTPAAMARLWLPLLRKSLPATPTPTSSPTRTPSSTPSPTPTPNPYFEGPFEQEPNNTAEQANGLLRSGRDYLGYANDRNDYFTFSVSSAGSVTLDLTNFTGQDAQLQLYYESTASLVAFDAAPPYHIAYDATPGRYLIRIVALSGYNTNTVYTLRATSP